MAGPKVHWLTAQYNGIARLLAGKAWISAAHHPAPNAPLQSGQEFEGIWDTGASHTTISGRVVSALGLQRTGFATSNTANGPLRTEQFLVNLELPSRVQFLFLPVIQGNLPAGIDFLIGMDIISMGDFAVTNKDGKTTLSFRVPSMERIDFAPRAGVPAQSSKVGRNQLCPCGSGKKHKYCCGR